MYTRHILYGLQIAIIILWKKSNGLYSRYETNNCINIISFCSKSTSIRYILRIFNNDMTNNNTHLTKTIFHLISCKRTYNLHILVKREIVAMNFIK